MFESPQQIKASKVNGFLVSTVDLKSMSYGSWHLETMVFIDGEWSELFCHRTSCPHESKRVHEIQELVCKLFRTHD